MRRSAALLLAGRTASRLGSAFLLAALPLYLLQRTGSLTLYHVDSGFARKMADLQTGVDRRFTLISKLADPDSYGAERVAAYNLSFDDLTLADWQAAAVGTVTAAFTFSRYEFLDMIEVQ